MPKYKWIDIVWLLLNSNNVIHKLEGGWGDKSTWRYWEKGIFCSQQTVNLFALLLVFFN
jgi:hypothetical protein